jgi:N-methylhydantoinase A
MEAAFHAEHARTYGHSSPGDPLDLINIRVVASTQPPGREGLAAQLQQALSGAPQLVDRPVYFNGALVDTPVVPRAALENEMRGPFIVEEFDATCVVPPGASGVLDRHGNLVIDAGVI